MIDALRTPEARFHDLPGFPYPPRYLEHSSGLRMAYVEAGPTDGDVVLCLHGEPTWGYLYRKMIPVFASAGLRVVVPDLFGFGRSDKPIHDSDYTFEFHRNSILDLVDALDLRGVTLVVQDWGGLLGLTLPVDRPDLVSRLLVMNTGLGVGSKPAAGFIAWRDYVARTEDLDVAALMARSVDGLSPDEAAAYAAPFPGPEYKAGVRRFPQLVPITPDDPGVDVSRAAARWWKTTWDGRTFMAVGANDPILGPPVMSKLRAIINGCPEPLMVHGGHFVPESGEQIALAALEAWSR